MEHHIDIVFKEMLDDINYLKVATVVKTKFVDLTDGYKVKGTR